MYAKKEVCKGENPCKACIDCTACKYCLQENKNCEKCQIGKPLRKSKRKKPPKEIKS